MPTSPRITLRPLVLPDARVFASWGLDRRFCEHAGWTVDLPLSTREAKWRTLIAEPKPNHLRLAAVTGAQVVGYVDFAGGEPERRELGYVVGPSERWGQGLGRAIARLGLDHGFHHLGLREIWAEALDANQASVRIITSLGMIEIGEGQEGTFLGAPTVHRKFSIAVEAWRRRP